MMMPRMRFLQRSSAVEATILATTVGLVEDKAQPFTGCACAFTPQAGALRQSWPRLAVVQRVAGQSLPTGIWGAILTCVYQQ